MKRTHITVVGFITVEDGGKEPIAKNCKWLPEAENNSWDSQQGNGDLSLTTAWSRFYQQPD